MTDRVDEKAKDFDWQTATALVDKVINDHASRIITDGKYGHDAIDRAVEIQAAWLRVQRG